MLRKRSQITLIIIFSLIFIITVFYIFYNFQINVESEDSKFESSYQSFDTVTYYIEDCLSSTLKNGVSFIGKRAGYYNLNEIKHIDYLNYKTAYYFYETENLVPSISKVEIELSNYINENLIFCLQNFYIFEEMGIFVSQGEINSNVLLRESDIFVELNYFLTLEYNNQERLIETFHTSTNSNFKKMLNSAFRITENENINNICFSCYHEESTQNNLDIELLNINNNSILVKIISNDTDEKLVYSNKYLLNPCINLNYETDSYYYDYCSESQALIIAEIPNFNLTVNEEFYYQINLNDENFKFTSFTSLFEINQSSGEINFTPSIEDVGNHTIWLLIESDYEEKYKSFEVNINE